MKNLLLVAATLGVMLSADALAQPSTLVGNWVANWEANGRPMEARLEIGQQGNIWRALATNRRNACVGIDAPVEVNYISDNEINMILSFSRALHGCTDVILRLHRTADGNLAGERDNGTTKADITLKRP